MICKKCGAMILTSNTLHENIVQCPDCGTVYRRKPRPAQNNSFYGNTPLEKKICPQCGIKLDADDIYCPSCGCSVDLEIQAKGYISSAQSISKHMGKETPNNSTNTFPYQNKKTAVSKQNRNLGVEKQNNYYENALKRTKKRKGEKLIVGILASLIVMFLIVGVQLCIKAFESSDVEVLNTNNNTALLLPSVTTEPEKVVKQLTPIQYLFKNGPLLAQGNNSLWGYIDENGKWVVEPKYDNWYDSIGSSKNAGFASRFNNGHAVIEDSSTGSFGVIDTNGNWLVEPAFLTIEEFQDGLAVAQDAITSNWGLINEDYQWYLEPRFKKLKNFQEGLAAACDVDTGKWGFIDHSGNWIIEPQYRRARSFVSGYAPVQDCEKYLQLPDEQYGGLTIAGGKKYYWGYIDKNGNSFLDPQYMDAYGFTEGLAPVQSIKTKKWGFIDESANLVIPCQFTRVTSFSNGRSFGSMSTENDDLVMMIDEKGATHRLPHDYTPNCVETNDGTLEHVSWTNNCVILHWNKSNCVVDLDGNTIFSDKGIDGTIYGIPNKFGHFYVKDTSSRRGVMDQSYNWIIDPKYSSIRLQDNEYIASGSYRDDVFDTQGHYLRSNNREGNPTLVLSSEKVDGKTKIGYKDFDGNLIIDYLYEKRSNTPTQFSKYAVIGYDGLTGVIDCHGEWIVEPIFQDIDCF